MQGSNRQVLKKEIDKLGDIPMLSSRTLCLIKVATDPNVELHLIVQEIEKNQTVLLKVLSIANSSFFRGHTNISNAKEAVVRIGLNQIGGVVISLTLGNVLVCRDSPYFNKQSHWLEAVITAYMVSEISRLKKTGRSNFLYTVGLLHNMGSMLLVHLFPERMERVLEQVQPIDDPYIETVVDNFGFDPFEALSWLLERWRLPDEFAGVISHLGKLEPIKKDKELVECLLTARKSALFLLGNASDTKAEIPSDLEQYSVVLLKARNNFENLVSLASTMTD